MTDLTDPLTPSDCDLRGLPFMPLDVIRLLDSDLFAKSSGPEFKAAVALWCKSWTQVPAASVPDDDAVLAHLSGAAGAWKKVKAGALRGWVKCSDGRLYHPVVAEKAREALPGRRDYKEKQTSAAERKAREREDRRKLFALLREHGVTPDWDCPTKKLREMAGHYVTPVTLLVTEQVTPVTDGVTAKRGTGTGTGTDYLPPPLSARENLDHLEHDLRKAAGAESNPSPSLMVVAPILGLIDQGADLESEILPAIAAKPKPDVRSWDYFVPQIQEFRARRQRAAGAPLPNGTGPPHSPAKRNPAIALYEQQRADYDESADEPYVPNASRA